VLNKLALKILEGVVKEDNSSAVYHNAVLLNIIFQTLNNHQLKIEN
jgi:hypothetical protein